MTLREAIESLTKFGESRPDAMDRTLQVDLLRGVRRRSNWYFPTSGTGLFVGAAGESTVHLTIFARDEINGRTPQAKAVQR